MSRVDEGKELVERLRKRPSETSTSAKTVRKPFGDQAIKKLLIPAFDDNYNHGMGYVDQGNQLKKPNSLSCLCRKGGHQSLTNWELDTVLVNSYKLSFHSKVDKRDKWTDQEKFRTAIIKECFALGKQARLKRKRSSSFTAIPLLDTPLNTHSIEHREYKQECVVCKKEGTSRGVSKRRALGEISDN